MLLPEIISLNGLLKNIIPVHWVTVAVGLVTITKEHIVKKPYDM